MTVNEASKTNFNHSERKTPYHHAVECSEWKIKWIHYYIFECLSFHHRAVWECTSHDEHVTNRWQSTAKLSQLMKTVLINYAGNVDSGANLMTELCSPVIQRNVGSTAFFLCEQRNCAARRCPSIPNKLLALHSMCLLYIWTFRCLMPSKRNFYCRWTTLWSFFMLVASLQHKGDVRGHRRTIGTRKIGSMEG